MTTPSIPASTQAPPECGAQAAHEEVDAGLAEKQQMIEKLFRHTNTFLEEHKHDPLLVVEALAAIVVRYAALFGPVEQTGARLAVLERLIGQESAAIQTLATAQVARKGG